jgi:hypothetical protein
VTGVTVDVLTIDDMTFGMLVAETPDRTVAMASSVTRSYVEDKAALVQGCLQRYHLDRGVPSSQWPVVDLAELDRLSEEPSTPLPGPKGTGRILEAYGWVFVLLAWSIGGPLLFSVVPFEGRGDVFLVVLAGLFILAMIRMGVMGRR